MILTRHAYKAENMVIQKVKRNLMKMIWQLFYYYLITPVLIGLFILASLFSVKIRNGLYPRFSSVRRLLTWVKKEQPTGKIVLFHASSYGEFEHIRPVLQMLKTQFQTVNIVSFFSPSGYKNAADAEGLDFHFYMPFDLPGNWKRIYQTLNPVMVIVAKWDVWPAQVWTAKENKLPIYLINASLRRDSTRIKIGIKQFLKHVFRDYSKIYAVSDVDGRHLLEHFPGCQIEVAGDTKYDQVVLRKNKALSQELIPETWLNKNLILMAGSIWPEDEYHLFPAVIKLLEEKINLRLVLVPHEPDQKSIENIEKTFYQWGVQKFSLRKELTAQRVLVVDVIGFLAGLYHHADIAYVGGSFRQGIHNVMEPAIFGLPVLFGPVHDASYEAVQFTKNNGAIVVYNEEMIYKTLLNLIDHEDQRIILGKKSEKYALRNTGTTQRLIKNWHNLLVDQTKKSKNRP